MAGKIISMKNYTDISGIEPVTFQHVAQCKHHRFPIRPEK